MGILGVFVGDNLDIHLCLGLFSGDIWVFSGDIWVFCSDIWG